MRDVRGFVAYPSTPQVIGETVEAAIQDYARRSPGSQLTSWRETDVAGQFIGTQITTEIGTRDILVADISRLNFNVTYEIGFAIGKRKRLLLIRHDALEPDYDAGALGIFDTIGHREYQNSQQLAEIFRFAHETSPMEVGIAPPNLSAPVYLLDAMYKTDQVRRILSRVKKAKLSFRSFDPNEQPRLSALEAIKNVSQSYGVLLHLLPNEIRDAKLHNLRAAFLAGLADGMDKVQLLLQLGDGPVPLDYRDLVTPCFHFVDIDAAIGNFATDVFEACQTRKLVVPEPSTFLAGLNLGASAAENELRDLSTYYVETDTYKRALRGEARMVVGRKGAGKTAIFFQVRDRIRQDRSNVVLDLKPDGYQLLKFKDSVLKLMSEGTYQHTITAFWEYLLLLEICHKIIEEDRVLHTRDNRLYNPYRALADAYASDEYVEEGDFSERMAHLIRNITDGYQKKHGFDKAEMLSAAELTELLYMHDVAKLRGALEDYMRFKRSVWILFDNLDKGWPSRGLTSEDLVILRALDDAARKVARQLERHEIETRTLIFLRQDIYELLVEATSDRGKEARVSLDWSHPDLLRELLRRRFVFSGAPLTSSFDDVWREICVSHVVGEESAQYLIDRCLMRPRFLIDLVHYCRGFAVNLGHSRIEESDIEKGLGAYSDDLVRDIGLEIRDTAPELENVLYAFIDVEDVLSPEELDKVLMSASFDVGLSAKAKGVLLWYGALGIMRAGDEAPQYIYDLGYNMNVMQGMIRKDGDFLYSVNPALWKGLAIRTSVRRT
jgi:hypothetical protein